MATPTVVFLRRKFITMIGIIESRRIGIQIKLVKMAVKVKNMSIPTRIAVSTNLYMEIMMVTISGHLPFTVFMFKSWVL
jgi:hypothetical protein